MREASMGVKLKPLHCHELGRVVADKNLFQGTAGRPTMADIYELPDLNNKFTSTESHNSRR